MEDAQLRLSDIGEIEKISIDIKKSFIEKLKSFEFSSQISNEIRNEVLDKILHMEVRLNDPDSIQKMYQILYQSPIDIVVENIKENDIDVLLQKIKTAM
jgi:hypothetical protein